VTTGDLLIPGFQQEFTNDNTGMGAKPIWTGRRLLISQSPTELLNYETVLVSSGRNSLPEPFTHHDTHDACVPYIVKRMSFHGVWLMLVVNATMKTVPAGEKLTVDNATGQLGCIKYRMI